MLAHSRGGSAQRDAVDLNSLVSEAVDLAYHGLRAQDASFNITLEYDLESDLPPLKVVPQDLSRVFLNIANNGCYAAHHRMLKEGAGYRPVLRTTTRQTPDVVQKIFNPFFTTKPAGQRTGLGLSLSYQIVTDQHKGSIKVNSQEGEFTEFVITLPK
jgi:signal transduction histidine kinase